MALRYIIRRQTAEDLEEIKSQTTDLMEQLGTPNKDLKRNIVVEYNAMRSAVFQFFTRKTGEEWIWVCPSIELIAEDEKGIFTLTDQFKVAPPAHIRHLREQEQPSA